MGVSISRGGGAEPKDVPTLTEARNLIVFKIETNLILFLESVSNLHPNIPVLDCGTSRAHIKSDPPENPTVLRAWTR